MKHQADVKDGQIVGTVPADGMISEEADVLDRKFDLQEKQARRDDETVSDIIFKITQDKGMKSKASYDRQQLQFSSLGVQVFPHGAMNKRFLLVIVLAMGPTPYAWIPWKELVVGPHGPSAVQQDVIRAYYEALDTCDVKAFERLSIRGPDDPQWVFNGLWPNESIQWAKLLSISGPYPANEGDAHKHGPVHYLKSKPAGLVNFRVEEVIKRKEKWWPDKDTKSILMVKKTEDSNWLIAAVGH